MMTGNVPLTHVNFFWNIVRHYNDWWTK